MIKSEVGGPKSEERNHFVFGPLTSDFLTSQLPRSGLCSCALIRTMLHNWF